MRHPGGKGFGKYKIKQQPKKNLGQDILNFQTNSSEESRRGCIYMII